jgi:hypothetical protein
MWGQRQFGKSLRFDFFLHPSLMSVLMMLYVQTAANIFVIQKRKDKVGKPGVVRRVRQTHPGSNSVHCSVLQTFS